MSFGHFEKSRQAHHLSDAVNQLITRRIRPVRAFAAGRNDLRRDEESQHELPTSAPDPRLQRTSSIQEIFHSRSQEDHPQDEKAEVGIVHNIVEETRCASPPVLAGQVGKRKKFFSGFKNVKPKTPFTLQGQIKYVLLHSWLMNLVMPCCPVGLVLYHTSGKSTATFVVNFLATLPANFLGNLAMTEIGLRVPRLFADWMSMTTGTFVGCCNRPYQNLNRTAAHMASNLLSLSATSLLIPTASHLLNQAEGRDLLRQSRGVSIVLLVVYACFVICEHWTHWEIFSREVADVPTRPFPFNPISYYRSSRTLAHNDTATEAKEEGPVRAAAAGQSRSASPSSQAHGGGGGGESVPDEDEPRLHLVTAILLLAGSTVLLYYHIDYSVQSIEALTKAIHLSKTFVGLVLFPLANVDYHPIMLAINGKLGQTVTQTVGKSIQTALLVMPCIVLVAWIWGLGEVTLVFNGFEVVSLFASVLLLNVLMVDAKLHWVQGILLMADWALIAIAAYFATKAKE
ncbi:calcium/proton exchanger, partial [Metarhizium majus ARSEF 297]